MHRIRGKLTYANVMVTILAFIVLAGGSAFAATQMLPKNSVGPKQLRKGAVTTTKIAKSTRQALVGSTGARGPAGPSGPAGACRDCRTRRTCRRNPACRGDPQRQCRGRAVRQRKIPEPLSPERGLLRRLPASRTSSDQRRRTRSARASSVPRFTQRTPGSTRKSVRVPRGPLARSDRDHHRLLAVRGQRRELPVGNACLVADRRRQGGPDGVHDHRRRRGQRRSRSLGDLGSHRLRRTGGFGNQGPQRTLPPRVPRRPVVRSHLGALLVRPVAEPCTACGRLSR